MQHASKQDQNMSRRQFMRMLAGGVIGGSALGVGGLAAFSANHNPGDACRYWQQRNKGTMSDTEYIAMCGLCAASPHNTQPWKFNLQGDRIGVFADTSRHLGNADAERRMMLMSVGCAVENMTVAARRLGYTATVEGIDADHQFATSGYCATVKLARGPVVTHPWFDAIFDRQTTRTGFDMVDARPDALIAALERQDPLPGISQIWFSASEAAALVPLAMSSVRSFVQDERKYGDAMKWFRITREEWERKGDGISIFNTDAPFYVKEWIELITTKEDLLGPQFKQGEIDTLDRLAPATQAWGLIYADHASPNARVQAGRMAARVYLEATAQGYAIQPICYPTEIPAEATRLKAIARLPDNSDPLFLFRVGRANMISKSVRRNLAEVIIS